MLRLSFPALWSMVMLLYCLACVKAHPPDSRKLPVHPSNRDSAHTQLAMSAMHSGCKRTPELVLTLTQAASIKCSYCSARFHWYAASLIALI
eukprot:COSAG05_NODE_17971_length_316_cov_0.714286_1_plen_91_part_10